MVVPVRNHLEWRALNLKNRKIHGNTVIEKAFNIEIREHLNSELARMFYPTGFSFHLTRNPYYIFLLQIIL